jgi:hypothetical protein
MIRGTVSTVISLIFLVFSSCDENNYCVDGKIAGSVLDGDTLHFRRYSDNVFSEVGYTVVRDGEFEFEGFVSEPYVAGIFMGELLVMPLVVEPGDIVAEISDRHAVASGTALNEALSTYITKFVQYGEDMNEASKSEARLIMEGRSASYAREVMEQKTAECHSEMETFVEKFITDHYGDILGPLIFKQWFGLMLNPLSSELFMKIIDAAPESFKEDKDIKGMVEYMNVER